MPMKDGGKKRVAQEVPWDDGERHNGKGDYSHSREKESRCLSAQKSTRKALT